MPGPIRLPTSPSPAISAWCRVLGLSSSLLQALDQLDDAGGASAAATAGKWSPEAMDKAIGTLEAVREGLGAEVARLASRRRHFPRRRLG